jgi:ATP-dependent helicase YprA (DUF1998 family)
VIVDGHRIACKVLREVLNDLFRAEAEGALYAFLKHSSDIEEKARELIEQEKFQLDGSILISTFDLGARQGSQASTS